METFLIVNVDFVVRRPLQNLPLSVTNLLEQRQIFFEFEQLWLVCILTVLVRSLFVD